MGTTRQTPVELIDDTARHEAERWAGAFLASFSSGQTRRAYRGNLRCWFTYCNTHGLHPGVPWVDQPICHCPDLRR